MLVHKYCGLVGMVRPGERRNNYAPSYLFGSVEGTTGQRTQNSDRNRMHLSFSFCVPIAARNHIRGVFSHQKH